MSEKSQFEKGEKSVFEREFKKLEPARIVQEMRVHIPKEKVSDAMLEQMVRVLARLTFQVRNAIRNCKTVVSDDASGRIPAHFFSAINNIMTEKGNMLTGYAMGHRQNIIPFPQMAQDLLKYKPPYLVVTQQMATGDTLVQFLREAKKAGIDPDTITIVSIGADTNAWKFVNHPSIGKLFAASFRGKAGYFGEEIFGGESGLQTSGGREDLSIRARLDTGRTDGELSREVAPWYEAMEVLARELAPLAKLA